MTHRVKIKREMVVQEDRIKKGMWKHDFREPMTYKVNVFRQPHREWIESNLKGVVKCCYRKRAFRSIGEWANDFYFASFSRAEDAILFKLKFSDMLL